MCAGRFGFRYLHGLWLEVGYWLFLTGRYIMAKQITPSVDLSELIRAYTARSHCMVACYYEWRVGCVRCYCEVYSRTVNWARTVVLEILGSTPSVMQSPIISWRYGGDEIQLLYVTVT